MTLVFAAPPVHAIGGTGAFSAGESAAAQPAVLATNINPGAAAGSYDAGSVNDTGTTT